MGTFYEAIPLITPAYDDGFRYYADGFLRWTLLRGCYKNHHTYLWGGIQFRSQTRQKRPML